MKYAVTTFAFCIAAMLCLGLVMLYEIHDIDRFATVQDFASYCRLVKPKKDDLHRQWEERIESLRADPLAARSDYDLGVSAGDFSRAHATAGEAIGLIRDLPGASDLIQRMDQEAGRAAIAVTRVTQP